MNNYRKIFALSGLAVLASTTALAADLDAVKDLSNGSAVSINGIVDKVNNEREFVLRNNSQTIDIDIASNKSVVLKQGQSVTVNGVVDKGVLSTDINANEVIVNSNLAQKVGDSIEGNTTISLEGANSYDIDALPKKGLVKVFGKVSDVDNEKEFTLKDATGEINVDIESAESAALTEGAEVTVLGYVDSGMTGTDIKAQRVIVTEDAEPAAGGNY